MNAAHPLASTELTAELAELVEQLTARIKAGESFEDVLNDYPAHAGELRKLLPAMQLLADFSDSPAAQATLTEPLGDFRLLREVGRGGMGIVYEAEQLSLGRRVAIKVLPFAATMDPRALQRFKNESKAAASLRHENIVHVYGVGCERSVHFYAMEFVEGQTLAQIIHGLWSTAPTGEVTSDYVPGRSEAPTKPVAALSTAKDGSRGREFFRRAVEIIAQAADALEHAHSLGIVHRDVKPGNLLVDAAGKVYVSDFGLARIGTDAGMTMTGDLVGTLRYMAPEQAMARHGLADHRVDVYGLGASLYELVTGHHAVAGENKEEILKQIAFEEPTPLRKFNKAIPAELETITLKALAKNPNERYATAGDLAADLRRWLNDKSIKAKPPGVRQRMMKWTRRHKALTTSLLFAFALLVSVGVAAGFWWGTKRAIAQSEARAALQEAAEFQKEEKWYEALSAVRRAKVVLVGVGANQELLSEVDDLNKDLEMVLRLEEAQVIGTEVKDDHFDGDAKDSAIVEAFTWYGCDIQNGDIQSLGDYFHSRSIRVQLATAIDEVALRHGQLYSLHAWSRALQIAKLTDPEPWRCQLRDARLSKDMQAIEEVVMKANPAEMSPTSSVLLHQIARGTAAANRSLEILRSVQQRHPQNFWINTALGHELSKNVEKKDHTEALRFFTAAAAIRPQSPGARVNVGYALNNNNRKEEAAHQYEEAVRLKPDYKVAFQATLNRRKEIGQIGAAIRTLEEAIGREPDNAYYHEQLLKTLHSEDDRLRNSGRLEVADRVLQRRVDVAKQAAEKGFNSIVLWEEITQSYKDAKNDKELLQLLERMIAQYPNHAAIHNTLAFISVDMADEKKSMDRKKALHHAQIATQMGPKFWQYWYTLYRALYVNDQYEEAILALEKSIKLNPDGRVRNRALAWHLVSTPIRQLRDPQRALKLVNAALKNGPTTPEYYDTRGIAYFRTNEWQKAIEDFSRARRNDGVEVYAHTSFFISMAHLKLGDHKQSRTYYDQGLQHLHEDKFSKAYMKRFCLEVQQEAAQMLGIESPGPTPNE